jgi:long-subunit fatty acid transport protein
MFYKHLYLKYNQSVDLIIENALNLILMKNIYISVFTFITALGFAQESTLADVLRYSNTNLNGTARYQAMGGAFGALGGDLSALSVNPAGSTFFNENTASASLTSYNKRNNSSYFGESKVVSDSSLDMNQIGGVLVFTDNSKYAEWNKFTIGLNYDNVGKFNDYTSATGTNPFSSIDSYFLNKAQGRVPQNLVILDASINETRSQLYQYLGESGNFDAQQAFLGYQSYILDTNSNLPNNNIYFSNSAPGNKFRHTNTFESTGYNGKMALNFASSYKDKLSLGMNLNFFFTDYRKTSVITENNQNPIFSTGTSVTNIRFQNDVYTYGNGFSLQLGAIYKFNNNFRVGFNYDSPTWYNLNDELTQSIATNSVEVVGTTASEFSDVVAPDVVNIYQPYNIQTPQKFTGSAAYIFGKKGLLSVDYGYKDYSTSRIKPKNDGLYNSINNQARNLLGGSKEIKLGGEYRVLKQVSLRGGYRFDESPFITDAPYGNLTAYSGGIGYSWGDAKLDLSYTQEHRNYSEAFLTSDFNFGSRVRNYNNNVTLTYTVSF